jgi:hypothetical protein
MLPEHQVDIWLIDLVGQSDKPRCYRRSLSQDEVEGADRFYFEKNRQRFTLARGVPTEKSIRHNMPE